MTEPPLALVVAVAYILALMLLLAILIVSVAPISLLIQFVWVETRQRWTERCPKSGEGNHGC